MVLTVGASWVLEGWGTGSLTQHFPGLHLHQNWSLGQHVGPSPSTHTAYPCACFVGLLCCSGVGYSESCRPLNFFEIYELV